MRKIERKPASLEEDIEMFLSNVNFLIPIGFIDFYRSSNGAIITGVDTYIDIWPITKLQSMNEGYKVHIYAPEFFIFATDGGDTAYAIERSTGFIFDMPFIGMSRESAILISRNMNDFVDGTKIQDEE